MTQLDYSVSQFWNTTSFRWEVWNDKGEVVASGIAVNRVQAQLLASKMIARLSA